LRKQHRCLWKITSHSTFVYFKVYLVCKKYVISISIFCMDTYVSHMYSIYIPHIVYIPYSIFHIVFCILKRRRLESSHNDNQWWLMVINSNGLHFELEFNGIGEGWNFLETRSTALDFFKKVVCNCKKTCL